MICWLGCVLYQRLYVKLNKTKPVQPGGAAEYTDCITAEG